MHKAFVNYIIFLIMEQKFYIAIKQSGTF